MQQKGKEQCCTDEDQYERGEALPYNPKPWFFHVFAIGRAAIGPVDGNGKRGDTQQHILRKFDNGTDFQRTFAHQAARCDDRPGGVYTAPGPGTSNLFRETTSIGDRQSDRTGKSVNVG